MTYQKKISNGISFQALTGVRLKSLWALDAMTNISQERFTAAEIAEYLTESCHESTSRQAVTSTLDSAKNLTNKNLQKGGYKLMESGRQELAAEENGGVHILRAGQPFTAKSIVFKSIVAKLKGTIRLCDPYVDVDTLDLIYRNFERNTPIKILTHKLKDNPTGTFGRVLSDLRKEGFNIEVGIFPKPDIHDRYILDDLVVWTSGNSLNHLGDKESFLTCHGTDIQNLVSELFNTRWSLVTKI